MDGDYESDHQQLLSRRERLRAQRQAAHSAPARLRLRLGAVIVIIAALLSWLLVSWLGSATSSGEALPEPPPLEHSAERPVEHPEPAQQGSGTEPDSGQPDSHETASVVVHVAGAVRDPQVVELNAGARAAEAVEAAGGLTADAAAQGVNLAAQVTDGSFIWVPTVDEFAEGDPGPPAAADPGAGQAGEGAPININTAGADQLEELTGIGPALAERIITYRESNGGFSSLDELAAVSGIGPSILENIADDVDW